MPSMQSTILLITALLSSVIQHAAAAPEVSIKRTDVQVPPCISTCMRNSGCFDTQCVCKQAPNGILSDIVICMNQWCPADITAKNLVGILSGECDLPSSAVEDAERKGGVLTSTSTSTPTSDDTKHNDNQNNGDNNNDGKDGTGPSNPTTSPAPKKNDDNANGNGNDNGNKGGEIFTTFDLAPPVTFAAQSPTTTAKADVSSASDVSAQETASASQSSETHSGSSPKQSAASPSDTAVTGTFMTMSPSATPSPSSSASNNSTSSSNSQGSGAGFTSQSSIFGVVAAMAVALAMGL